MENTKEEQQALNEVLDSMKNQLERLETNFPDLNFDQGELMTISREHYEILVKHLKALPQDKIASPELYWTSLVKRLWSPFSEVAPNTLGRKWRK